MAYTKYHDEWKPYPDVSTLVTSDGLNHIENGIVATSEVADDALAKAEQALASIDGLLEGES